MEIPAGHGHTSASSLPAYALLASINDEKLLPACCGTFPVLLLPYHLKKYEIRCPAFYTMYAIVDIETTGSYAAANGITEICIHIFDGTKVISTFETLINPCQSIP